MNIEFNKFFGATTATILGVMLLGIGAEHLMHVEELEEPAYSVDVPESLAGIGGGAAEEVVVNMAALIAVADVANGEKVAKKCVACHAFEKGGANKTGPGLWGVLGADIAAHAGYEYSGALQEKEGNWDWDKLSAFLENPRGWAPGTKMGFAGLKKPEDRADIMAWMNAQSDSPLAAPEVVEDEPAATEEGAVETPSEEGAVETPSSEETEAQEATEEETTSTDAATPTDDAEEGTTSDEQPEPTEPAAEDQEGGSEEASVESET